MQAHTALALLLLAACGCASPAKPIDQAYQQFEADLRNAGSSSQAKVAERHAARIAIVHAEVEKNALETASDYFKAAVMLVDRTDRIEELALAYDLALRAAELGEERGFRVAAEAVDKQMVKQGMHQVYGTQYVYEAVLKGWRLYPVDPRTTDAQRQAMGVPPLDQLVADQERLNARKP